MMVAISANDRVLLSGAAIEIRPLRTKAKLLTKSLNKQQMQNCKTSARTAAQKSSKSRWSFRPAALAAILLLCAALSCNDGNPRVNEKVSSEDSSSLSRIENWSNFTVYILKRNSNEYILVNGINGVAIVKHR